MVRIDRRQALGLCLSGAATSWLGCSRRSGGGTPDARTSAPAPPVASAAARARADDSALDEALRIIHGQEPLVRAGLSTHAPMAAEALCSLGFGERAVAWVHNYDSNSRRLPPPTTRIDPRAWRSALGPTPGVTNWEESLPRWADWKELFVEQLGAAAWPEVLDLWTARLTPGLCAASTHGIIRTAHAARSLARRDTPERRAELARGLAYWAAAYQELPSRAAGRRASTLEDALERLPLYRDRHPDVPSGSIVAGIRAAALLDGFAEAKDMVELPAQTSAAVTALTATFARAYLRHANGESSAISFVHPITAANALRRIAEHVRPETARAAVPYVWQAAAAIYAGYANREDPRREPDPKLAPAELALAAAGNREEHVIKLTDALLEEHSIYEDPAYLAAAERAVRR